jgi:hypothetical protein
MKPIDNLIEHKGCPFITEMTHEFRDHGYKSEYPVYICRLQHEGKTYSEYCTVIDQLICPYSKEEKSGVAKNERQAR